ncbi:3-dehydroquinate synthase [Alphaproteobacteria bacterium]|jgi:3-dehydroquinate synthase|nr:3-dehydroquinate synthase [Alphaproteobacteria bacterium]
MDDTTSLRVGLGERAYDITIGNGLIAGADEVLGDIVAGRQIVIITDDNIAPLHLAALEKSVGRVARRCDAIIIPAGEASKSMAVLAQLLDDILGLGVDRGLLIIALGGGVIGDLAGFAAASLLRGVDFVQMPTSLLAQVDSSVGGKTGVNAKRGKNLIGAFYQPKAVLADTGALDSLPARELRAGYAEVVKYGLLGDATFFDWLEGHGDAVLARSPDALRHAIKTSCAAKARIVEADEREAGQRALLNLGHTFAHAFEAEGKYDGRLLHGEAVAAGMGVAFALSAKLGLCIDADWQRCRAHLQASNLPASNHDLGAGNAKAEALIAHMQHDKKVLNGKLRFVLARAIGDAFVADDVDINAVKSVLETKQ